MLQLHGTPVPSSALPRVPKDSSTLLSPLSSSSSSPHPSDRLPASHDHNVKFMSSMGSRRIFARNGGSGTVASVHQFQLEDTATTMDADESAMQSTVQDMEAAVAVILQEIGEDIERPVSHSCAFEDMCMPAVCSSQLLHFLCDGLEVSNFCCIMCSSCSSIGMPCVCGTMDLDHHLRLLHLCMCTCAWCIVAFQ